MNNTNVKGDFTFVVAVLVLHLREEVWRGDCGEEVILYAGRGGGGGDDGSDQLRRPDAHLHQLARGPLHGHAPRERLVARRAPAALPTETRRLPHAHCALGRVALREQCRSAHAAAVRLHAARRSRLRTVCRFGSGARRRGSSPAAACAVCAARAVRLGNAARRTPVRRSAAVRGTCNRRTRQDYGYKKCRHATSTNESAGGNGTCGIIERGNQAKSMTEPINYPFRKGRNVLQEREIKQMLIKKIAGKMQWDTRLDLQSQEK